MWERWRLEEVQVWADYHTHTRYSHGSGTVEENVAAASLRGLQTVGIADHGPNHLFGTGVKGLGALGRMRAEVDRVAALYPEMQVLAGVEANVISEDGELDVPPVVQEELDFVLAGIHLAVRPARWTAFTELFARLWGARVSRRAHERAREAATAALVNAVRRNRIEAIVHPGLQAPIDTRELARACAREGTALEINAGHRETTLEFLRIALDEGAEFIVGSDAHEPGRVGDVGWALELARAAGVPLERIRNVRLVQERRPVLL